MKKNLDFLFDGTYVIFPLSDLFIEVIQLQFKTQINSQIENVRVKKRIIFSLLAIILIFMFLFLIYENFRMEKEIDRVVGMRARVMKDYIRKVGSQTRALGLSITDYLTFYENTPINPDLIKKFKNYPNLNRFGIPHISRENQEGSGPDAGTLTAVGSVHKLNPSLLKEIEAALNLRGQFESLTEKQSEVVWAYYLSERKFLYITPKFKDENYYFTDDLYAEPYWTQANPIANPAGRQIITDLYEDIAGKGLMISVSEPVYVKGKFMGVAAIDIGLDAMQRILESGDCIGRSMLIDENGKIVAKPDNFALNDRLPSSVFSSILESKKSFFLQKGSFWIGVKIKEEEIWLVHEIQIFEYIIYIIKNLLPFWVLTFTFFIVLVLYVKLRSSMNQVSKLIHTDPLTGIWNRRGFLKLTQRSIALENRHKNEWAILMIDIDHFKQVNDRFGHDAGDKTLIRVAQILSRSIRQTDVVCRWGGEEFAIFLCGVGQEISINIAEELRKEVENQIRLKDGNPVTLSIGVSGGKQNLEEAFTNADQALYQAKTSGRNRVCAFNFLQSSLK
ncbi:diguanylate cyclase [Leptospira interrogans]|nr:sensor domain-containing diguanylate cyclase [Leptospira interrogans]APH43399.1 Diguanylate cyclase (GGDEF) domain protein [Leptospira interrogans serovar Copenhageni/Icterohaemorrhagiae]OCC29491.1 GGDEF family protein [Leptospira interrogans serovar Canicola]ARB94279.2 sensor domain-containing diguanylate cyclase [Leptospira interrogans serovar Copenhageni]KAA5552573.1 diguanylate cyclase [Leptospira interrogans serovar Copenhageni]KPA30967.1 GGDEF family protein [Leptospira interrogans]